MSVFSVKALGDAALGELFDEVTREVAQRKEEQHRKAESKDTSDAKDLLVLLNRVMGLYDNSYGKLSWVGFQWLKTRGLVSVAAANLTKDRFSSSNGSDVWGVQ